MRKPIYKMLAIAVLVFIVTACVPDYTDEINTIRDRYTVMQNAWKNLMHEEGAIIESETDLYEVCEFYNDAILYAAQDYKTLDDMLDELDDYKDGRDEIWHAHVVEIISDARDLAEVRRDKDFGNREA